MPNLFAQNDDLEELAKEYAFYQIYKTRKEMEDDSSLTSPDLLVYIAYGLYKSDKIYMITSHKDSHNGEKPDKEHLENFQKTCCKPEKINDYIKNAEIMVSDTILALFREASKDIENKQKEIEGREKIVRENEKKIKQREKKVESREKTCPQTKFRTGVFQSMIASFLMIIISIIIILSLNGFNFNGIIDILANNT